MTDIRVIYLDEYDRAGFEGTGVGTLFQFAAEDYMSQCATPINHKTNFVVGGITDGESYDLENFLQLVVLSKAAVVVIDYSQMGWTKIDAIRQKIKDYLVPYGFKDLESYDITSRIAMGNFRWSNLNS